MLDLLVLGQVPGTDIQIGFSHVVLLFASLYGLYKVARIIKRNYKNHSSGHYQVNSSYHNEVITLDRSQPA